MARKLYQYFAQLSKNESYLCWDWFLFCKALFMASSLPHCVYLVYSTMLPTGRTLSHCLAIRTHSKICLPTLPPFGGVLLYIYTLLNLGSLLVVRLSLRCDYPQALGIARILPSYTFAFILSDPARMVLGR